MKYGIKIENSSSYHPAGNLLAEGTIRRVKNAIGGKTIQDAMDEILALNLVPREGHTLSLFKAMHTIASPASGIPVPESKVRWLTNRDWIDKKIAVQLSPQTSHQCPSPECITQDRHKLTREENVVCLPPVPEEDRPRSITSRRLRNRDIATTFRDGSVCANQGNWTMWDNKLVYTNAFSLDIEDIYTDNQVQMAARRNPTSRPWTDQRI